MAPVDNDKLFLSEVMPGVEEEVCSEYTCRLLSSFAGCNGQLTRSSLSCLRSSDAPKEGSLSDLWALGIHRVDIALVMFLPGCLKYISGFKSVSLCGKILWESK